MQALGSAELTRHRLDPPRHEATDFPDAMKNKTRSLDDLLAFVFVAFVLLSGSALLFDVVHGFDRAPAALAATAHA